MLILALSGAGLGFVFLVVSLVTDTPAWAWGCIGMCVLAAGALLIDGRRRRAPRSPAAGAGAGAGAETVLAVSAPRPEGPTPQDGGVEPDEEDVDAADALATAGLGNEVLVVDEHPRFHLPSCPWLAGRPTTGLPAQEAVELGFSPCARCRPSYSLAAGSRAGLPG